jgi:hypothetical protein
LLQAQHYVQIFFQQTDFEVFLEFRSELKRAGSES